MHFFSRNKALIAASVVAVGVLAACGDDVTVPPAINPPVQVTMTPLNANLNIGESLNLAVQITGGSTTTPPTLASCTSSNTAVLTATVQGSACRATAVAAGNATVTAAASTGQQAASAITVAAAQPAIGNLTTSPTSANLTVGQSLTIVPNVVRANAANTVTYAYASSNTAVATVNATTGAVTAVAPGTATITVTATGSGTGYANATLTSGVTINVTAAPASINGLTVQPMNLTLALGATAQLSASVQQPSGAAAAVLTYGTNTPSVATVSSTGVVTGVAPGNAVIAVTATSPANASFGASTLTTLVPVTVTPAAQVIINSLTDNGTTIDITNVVGQFEVNLAVQPNGQNVQSVQAYVCNQGEAQAACIARGPAAQQTFGPAGAQAGFVQLLINSAEFTTPNFTTGDDANTLYKNGLKTIIATATVAGAAPVASNNLSSVNFNNPDGWTIQWTLPPNRANDVGGNTWYGGPHTPDALVPGSLSGTGSFVVVPVIYTPGMTITQATLDMTSAAGAGMCGSSILDTQRPFGASYGTQARSTTQTSLNFNCTGATTSLAGYAPSVVASIDNNQAAGPTATHNAGGNVAAATTIFTNITPANIVAFPQRYRISQTYRPTNIYVPGDYAAPVISGFDIRGGGGSSVDSAWLNGTATIAALNASGNPTDYIASDAGVGLLGTTTAARNTVFNICAAPASFSTTAATTCTGSAVVATGGITSTVASLGLPESATDFTNQAYFAVAIETDRLGNRVTSNPATYTVSGVGTFSVTPATGVTSAARPTQFGVDLTAPILVPIPNTGVDALANNVRTDVDSIYASAASGLTAAGGTTADAAVFGVRFTDARSGFFSCTASNCFVAAGVRGGTFQVVRRSVPAALSLTNDATVTNLMVTATSGTGAFGNTINAGTFVNDASIREFTVPVFGVAGRASATVAPTITVNQAGYYTFSGTLVDRAGNTTSIPNRSIAIDNASPNITSLSVPALLQGGSSVSFQPTGTDDLEAISGSLALRYPQMGRADNAAAVTGAQLIRFRRVPHFSATAKMGLWHNPFAAVTDNKLSTPIGPGTLLGSTPLTVPVPFIQHLTTVTNADAGSNSAADSKPDQVIGTLFDIRSTSTRAFTDSGRSTPLTATIFAGQVPTPTVNWLTSTGLTNWSAFNPAASTSSVEFRVTTSSSITNPPFARVHIVRLAPGGQEWEYLGDASALGPLDQGANRFWRYSFSFAGNDQGQFMMAALANGDVLRAIGVDANGNALSTRSATLGLPPALPGSVTVTNTAIVSPILNADAPQNITVGVSGNPNAANIVFGCSSNSSFVVAQMTGPTTCQLSPNGVAAAPFNVQITFTATGSVAGFNTNTISNTVTVSRAP